MILFQGTLDGFLHMADKENRHVVCFGAGDMGTDALYDEGLAHMVSYFVDNDMSKQKRLIPYGGRQIPVFSPDKLKDAGKLAILITSVYDSEIISQIDSWPELVDVPYAVFQDVQFAAEPGSDEFFRRRMLQQCLIEYESALRRRKVDRMQISKMLEQKRKQILGGYGTLIVPGIDVTSHTHCNLKCAGCSQLRPLFLHPKNIPVEKVIKDMELFFESVDECIRVTVGGEPFIYPDILKILKWLQTQEKAFSVIMFTNGLAMPDDDCLSVMKNPKFWIGIADYGMIQSMSKLAEKLEAAGVNFDVRTNQGWIDCGGVDKRGRTEKELSESYLRCNTGLICKSIYNGAMYCCNRAVFVHAIDCGYDSKRDYFYLDDFTMAERRKKIRDMFCMTNIADACDYCDQGERNIRKIEAGVQLGKDLQRSDYTLIRRDELESLRIVQKKWRE